MSKSLVKYAAVFQRILSTLPTGVTVRVENLLDDSSLPDVSLQTKKKYLREFIEQQPQYLEKLVGFYPTPSTIVTLVEQNRGTPIVESNLYESNLEAKRIVDGITYPIIGNFVQDSLGSYVSGANLNIPVQSIIDFLQDDYADFMAKSGNGLVSIAGSVNEHLLDRVLKNHGMVEEDDYRKTGKNSEADFIVYSSSKSQLGIEVKSYHARERLLRGLQDITGDKVGFGYFIDPSEFNEHRTRTLLQSGAAAIYMPKRTLDLVDPSAKSQITTQRISLNSKFYRPFEQFATDMKHFCTTGQLPAYV